MSYTHFFRNITGAENKDWVYCDTVKERNHIYGRELVLQLMSWVSFTTL